MERERSTKSDLLMASAACAWGFSYIFMKLGLGSATPLQLIFIRFGIAFPLLLLIFHKSVKPTRQELKYSFFLSLFIFMLSVCYTYGLKTTEASTAGFLAGTTVAMVPLFNGILRRKLPEKRMLLCAVLALSGVAVMSLTSRFTLAGGALLCLLGAAAYAVQIIVTNRALAMNCRSLVIGIWQLGFAALISGIVMVCSGEIRFSFDTTGWISAFGLGLLCTGYGYIAQTTAQKKTSPERIGFIYSLEPVFCAILAFFFFGELMSVREILGALLILVSIIL